MPNNGTLRRDPSAGGALLYELAEGDTSLSRIDRSMREAMSVAMSDTAGALDDIHIRPGAWTQVRSAAVAEARAQIEKAAKAVESARRIELPLLAGAIDGKRQVAPWVLETDRETRQWLRDHPDERALAIEAAVRALMDNPLDGDALEVVRTVATTPAVQRGDIAGPDLFNRARKAYWQSIAPEETRRYATIEAQADAMERNVKMAHDWALAMATADEAKVRELAKLRDAADESRGAVAGFLRGEG